MKNHHCNIDSDTNIGNTPLLCRAGSFYENERYVTLFKIKVTIGGLCSWKNVGRGMLQ